MFSRLGFAFGYVVGALALAVLFEMAALGCVSAPVRVAATPVAGGPLTLVAPFPTLPGGSSTGLAALAVSGATPSVAVESAVWTSDVLSVTVRASAIPGDYLFDAPILEYAGQVLPVTVESLAGARGAFLQLAVQSEVPATLVFAVPDARADDTGTGETKSGTLIFNPVSLESSLVNPLVRVNVVWPMPILPAP